MHDWPVLIYFKTNQEELNGIWQRCDPASSQGDLGARGGDHRQPGGHVRPSDKPATLQEKPNKNHWETQKQTLISSP